MRRRYLEGEALLVECRAGAGIIVIVEGETDRDDAWFYQQWFGDLAREIGFFAQNGWSKVIAAVSALREALPLRPIYGIVDRDFTEEEVIRAQLTQCPTDGVFRTPYFTLENALLDPAGWFEVACWLGHGPLSGWGTVADVTAHVAEAYRRCLPVAAFNRVVHDECQRTREANARKYLHDPAKVMKDLESLRAWGQKRSAPHDLGEVFAHRLAALEALPSEVRDAHVTGKAVLSVLAQRLNAALPRDKRPPTSYLVDAYLREHPTPPPALTKLIETIMRYAGR